MSRPKSSVATRSLLVNKLAITRAARFVAIALIATLMLAAPARAAGPKLTISPASLSFGNQELNTTSNPKNVTLTNPNASSLQIDSVMASAGDFSVSSDGCSCVGSEKSYSIA